MKKHILAATLALFILLSLTACSGSASPAQDPVVPTLPEISETSAPVPRESDTTQPSESPEITNDLAAYPLETYTGRVSDSKGYEVEQIVAIGDWVKSSDADGLAAAWTAIGGTGAPPSAEDFNGNMKLFKNNESVIVFGTMSMKNVTSGFDFSNENPYSLNWTLKLLGAHGNYMAGNFSYHEYAKLIVFYGSGQQAYENRSGTSLFGDPGFGPVPSAKMTSNSWGPVPFAIALPEVFTPKHPDGEPALDDCYFKLGDNEFTVGKTYDSLQPEAQQISQSDLLGVWLGNDQYKLEFMSDNTVVRSSSVSRTESEYFIDGSRVMFGETDIFTFIGIMQDGQLIVTYADGSKRVFDKE